SYSPHQENQANLALKLQLTSQRLNTKNRFAKKQKHGCPKKTPPKPRWRSSFAIPWQSRMPRHSLSRLTSQQSQQLGQLTLQLATTHHHMDSALLQQKLGTLEAFGQFLVHSLLNHARTGKTDQGIRLRNHHIAQKSETGRHTTHGGVSQNADKRQTRIRQFSQNSRRLE